jgi:predicted nucleic acid-binding protein
MICVDASLAAKWVLPEERYDQARALLTETMRNGDVIVAPHLLLAEVTNILHRRVVRGLLSIEDTHDALETFLMFPIRLRQSGDLHLRALTIANTFKLPAAYDAHYVGLAQILNCDLWTDDSRLIGSVAQQLPFVRWIGDYS